ncbi:hypothetical protein OEB99_04180 [Actinotalea sp. M2MS4P-6]|uniref:hypothetical protein n=1 Tax=Actinotalea sp. M2MS4P-6 TaxID=2983762 RepID=UPI0021E40A74|nr:hypothetical protein [Actinotalea sp. M2MS4P-6]MCV2393497.1 hypothetical protein [Actinotalea sp. M2MS4P-6]
MSTIPGDETWVDAGLVPQDPDAVREAADDVRAAEHLPSAARPDLADEASESDVVEQSLEAGDEDEDDYQEA